MQLEGLPRLPLPCPHIHIQGEEEKRGVGGGDRSQGTQGQTSPWHFPVAFESSFSAWHTDPGFINVCEEMIGCGEGGHSAPCHRLF